MEMIDDLNEEFWTRGDPAETAGYKPYHLVKCDKLDPPGNFSYGVFNEAGMLKILQLHFGATSRDPLTGMCNILLKLSEDEREITGVIIEDCDCVVLKSTLKEDEKEADPVANGEENGEIVIGEDEKEGKAATEEGVENGETATTDGEQNCNSTIEDKEGDEVTKIVDSNDNVQECTEEGAENT